MDQQLLVLITVADKQNFSRAAEELHMTQPAVSQHIQALERNIGARLLERNNKYVRLTKAGEIVYHHAKDILGSYSRMQRLIDELMNTEAGTFSIGASYTYGEYSLPYTIAYFRKRYPLITPTIMIANTREVTEQVESHQLDVGIIEGQSLSQTSHVEPFADDEMIVIVSSTHPLANRGEVELEELANETWIMREVGSGTREVVSNVFAAHDFSPQLMMEFGSTQIIKEAVEAGLGVSILSQLTIRKELSLDTLRALRIRDCPITRQFAFITQNTAFQTKAISLFLDFLRTHG